MRTLVLRFNSHIKTCLMFINFVIGIMFILISLNYNKTIRVWSYQLSNGYHWLISSNKDILVSIYRGLWPNDPIGMIKFYVNLSLSHGIKKSRLLLSRLSPMFLLIVVKWLSFSTNQYTITKTLYYSKFMNSVLKFEI